MVVIEVPKERSEEVLTILLENGSFRSLSKNIFVIEENGQETVKKIKEKDIDVEIIKS